MMSYKRLRILPEDGSLNGTVSSPSSPLICALTWESLLAIGKHKRFQVLDFYLNNVVKGNSNWFDPKCQYKEDRHAFDTHI